MEPHAGIRQREVEILVKEIDEFNKQSIKLLKILLGRVINTDLSLKFVVFIRLLKKFCRFSVQRQLIYISMNNLLFCMNLTSQITQTLLVSGLEESVRNIYPIFRCFFIHCCLLPPLDHRMQNVPESLDVLTIRDSRANVLCYIRISPVAICDKESSITHNCKHVKDVIIVSHKFAPQARTQAKPVIKEIRNQVILRHREHICGDASSFDVIDLLSRAWLLSCGYTFRFPYELLPRWYTSRSIAGRVYTQIDPSLSVTLGLRSISQRKYYLLLYFSSFSTSSLAGNAIRSCS